MKFMKKTAVLLFILVMVVTSNVPTQAAVTAAKTPVNSEEAQLKWAAKIGELSDWNTNTYNNLSEIAVNGGYIYAADDNKHRIIKVDSKSGKVVKEGKYIDSSYLIHYGASICYGDGKIFIGYDNGIIQAFNADTLESVWVSEQADSAVSSKFLYENDCLYVGTGTYSGKGSFYAILTKDEDTSKKDEVKKFLWRHETNSTFYWNQGVIVGNYVVAANNEGTLMILDKIDGNEKAAKKLDSAFSGGIAYDASKETIYLAAKESATLYGIKINTANGSFGEEKTVNLYRKGYVAGTPEVYNGKVYISGKKPAEDADNSYYCKGFMAVVDVNSEKYNVRYTVELPAYSQSIPTVVKTGADKVHVYFTINDEQGGVYAIEDSANATQSKLKEIYLPTGEKSQYCANNIHVDSEGDLYYINDSRTLFAIGKKTSAATSGTRPAAVKPITCKKTSTRKIKVSWKKKKGAKGYVIYAKAGKGKYKKIKTVGNVKSKTVTVKSGVSYKFKVKPYKNVKKGKKTVRKYYKAYRAKGKNGAKTLKVVYQNVTGYQGYVVYLKTGKGSYKKVKTTTKGGTIAYIKKNAKAGINYKFRLKGYKTVNGKKVYKTLK